MNNISPVCSGICETCNEPNNCGFLLSKPGESERRCKWDSPEEIRPKYTGCIIKERRNGRNWPMYVNCVFFGEPGFEEIYNKK